MNTLSEFSKEALRQIQLIPPGQVATYGYIARVAGHPRGGRTVGWLLHSCTISHKLPWQRVLKSNGALSFPPDSPQYLLQKELLEQEGIVVIHGQVDLKKYFWKEESDS